MNQTTPSRLADALWPEARQRVLGALLLDPEQELHLRELARRVGMAPATVQREVGLLTQAGVLERREAGRQVYYRAAQACPVYAELRSMVLKTVGLVDVLARALAPLQESIDVAFVFGSMAAGTERADSDVDLMVVGNATLRGVSGALGQARAASGRELNVVTLTAAELRRRVSEQDHFVTTVLGDPKLFVKGTADDLERVARAGVNSARQRGRDSAMSATHAQPTLPPDVAAKLDEAVRRIVDIAGPQLVILFGSYAEGTANEDSDIDLLVVAETERLIATEVQLSRALREVLAPLAFDLVVHTPDWWEKARLVRGFVAREADLKGVRLYEVA